MLVTGVSTLPEVDSAIFGTIGVCGTIGVETLAEMVVSGMTPP